MYIKTFRFIVSSSIAVIAISVFSLQQYDQVQRMVALNESSSQTSTVATAEVIQDSASEQDDKPVPESSIPVETKSKPPESPDNEASALIDKLEYPKEQIEEQTYYALDTIPNDPIYPQWYTTIIDAPQAWDTTTGGSDFTVAVIDTGYALEHEDLASSWLLNEAEQGQTELGDICWSGITEDKQTNNCDDDGNGLVDDWRGWDFSNNDNNPQAGADDPAGATHGSKVAGLVGARSNNSLGVASINWDTKILPLQGLFDEGVGYSSDIAAAIIYATDRGADVINLSLGGPTPDSLILAAIQYADSNNVVVVAASGNCGDEQISPECNGYPSPGGMSYPARYDETIAVGATSSSDVVASFSSWGEELDLVAPGSGTIRTTSWSTLNETSLYSDTSFGTSFAAPIVSGLAGLVKSEFPELDTDEVLAILRKGVDRPAEMNGIGFTELYGYGRVNARKTLLQIDEYREDILKSGGTRGSIVIDTEQKPLITTNSGHSAETAIATETEIYTYCVTTPNTLCTLNFNKTGSSTVSLGSKKTNAQGIATWRWTGSDIGENGTWTATTVANLLTSGDELLIIE